MRRLVFAPSARDDLLAIARYVEDAAGTAIAAQVIANLRDICQLLADTSGEIGTNRDEVLEEIRSFPAKPYVLFFRYAETAVEIARVLHERQDVGAKFDEH